MHQWVRWNQRESLSVCERPFAAGRGRFTGDGSRIRRQGLDRQGHGRSRQMPAASNSMGGLCQPCFARQSRIGHQQSLVNGCSRAPHLMTWKAALRPKPKATLPHKITYDMAAQEVVHRGRTRVQLYDSYFDGEDSTPCRKPSVPRPRSRPSKRYWVRTASRRPAGSQDPLPLPFIPASIQGLWLRPLRHRIARSRATG